MAGGGRRVVLLAHDMVKERLRAADAGVYVYVWAYCCSRQINCVCPLEPEVHVCCAGVLSQAEAAVGFVRGGGEGNVLRRISRRRVLEALDEVRQERCRGN
jgi:hypothetical protein